MKSAWLDIVSGSRRGGAASAARAALRALSVPYGALASCRRWLYRQGALGTRRASIPVVSVGNITLGGTGKTPLVEHVARGLGGRGRRPAVVMRGYGARHGECCDEARLLRANLGDGVPIIEDPDRFRGCETAARTHGSDVAVLDDGFQHIRLARDLDVVALDATSPFGFGRLFPAGCLREGPRALARADVIVITRSDLPPAEEVEALDERVRQLAPEALVTRAVFAPSRVTTFNKDAQDGQDTRESDAEDGGGQSCVSCSSLSGVRLAVFCGIGNPRAFGLAVRRLGCEVVLERRFPDHHPFTPADLAGLAGAAGSRGARFVLTTQKDAARIARLGDDAWPSGAPPLHVLRAEFAFVERERAFWDAVEMALER